MLKIRIRHASLLLFSVFLLTGCVFNDNVKKIVLATKETAESNHNYFKVVYVVDGDTIDVDYYGKKERVRMLGINTPESVDPRRPVECFGKEASAEAKKLLLSKMVELEADQSQADRDKYGRMLRYVRTEDGLFYNQEIIKKGFAYEYTYKEAYAYQKSFKKAQAEAEKNKSGLWADNACGKKAAVKSAATSTPASAVPAKTNLCQIKGNISSKKKKIYHLPNCAGYGSIIIDPERGERIFCSENEAKKAGFRKADNCN